MFNINRGPKRVLREIIPVIFGLKPAVDAFRVASGAKIEKGQVVDPMQDMIYTKAIEMFAEAIPGVIIQLSASLSFGGEISTAAFVSLLVSALTTGFASATVSFDMDTDTSNRKNNPEFFGYIPDNAKKRTGKIYNCACEQHFAPSKQIFPPCFA